MNLTEKQTKEAGKIFGMEIRTEPFVPEDCIAFVQTDRITVWNMKTGQCVVVKRSSGLAVSSKEDVLTK